MRLQPQPLIAVGDVRASSRWYQHLLGCRALPEHEHRNLYERLFSDGEIVLQLHAWGEHDHPNLAAPGSTSSGNGVLLWFHLDDFDGAVSRARELAAEVLEQPHTNPNSGNREIWLRDPDGYVVVLSAGPTC